MSKLVTLSIKNNPQEFHWHEEIEIDLVIKGGAKVVINDDIFLLNEGDIIVVNCEDVHCIERSREDFTYIQVLLNVKGFDEYLPNISKVIYQCDPTKTDIGSESLKEEIRKHIAGIVKLRKDGEEDDETKKELIYSCVEVLRNLKIGFPLITSEEKGSKDDYYWERMWKIIEYMYDNCQRKLTLKEVADQVFLSEVYLSRILKNYSGKGFEEYLAFVRAEISIRYLLDRNMSISSVAYESGFSAPRYYKASFEKNYGCSPSEWREKNSNNLKPVKTTQQSEFTVDDSVDMALVESRLNEYSAAAAEDEGEGALSILVDISHIPKNNIVMPHTVDTVSCTMEQALDNRTLEQLRLCADELKLSRVFIRGEGRRKYRDVAIRNLQREGFEVVWDEAHSQMVSINDLFWTGGIKSVAFHMYKILAELGLRCSELSRDVYLYDRGETTGCVQLLITNYNGERDMTYLINFTGLREDGRYWKKSTVLGMNKEELSELRLSSRKMNEVALSSLEEYMQPHRDISICEGSDLHIVEVQLNAGQLCLVTLCHLM